MSEQQEPECFLKAYRSVGVFCDENKMTLNQTKDKDFLIASTNKSYKIYQLPSLQVKLNGIEFSHHIHAICGVNNQVFLSQKNLIIHLEFYHQIAIYHGHKHNVIGMSLLNDTLLSYDTSNLLLTRSISTYQDQQTIQTTIPDNIVSHIQIAFPIIQVLHPNTYINKVLVIGNQILQLVNVKTGKTIHNYQSILSTAGQIGSASITVIANSPVLNVVAIGYTNGDVQMLNLLTDTSIMTLSHSHRIQDLSFSQEDIPMLATADNQGQVVIWHLKDQQILTTFQAHTHSISTLLFATNNTIYTSSGQSNHVAQFKYDQENKSLYHLLRQRQGLTGDLQKVRFADQLGYDVLVSTNHHKAELKNILLNNEGFLPQYSLTAKQDKSKKKAFNECPQVIGEIKDSSFSTNNKYKHVMIRTADSKQYHIFDSENKRILKRQLDLSQETGLQSAYNQQQYLNAIWVTNCGNFGLMGYNNSLIIKINMQSNRVQTYKVITGLSSIKLLVSDIGNAQITVADDIQLIALDFLTLQTVRRVALKSPPVKYCLSRINSLLVIGHQDHSLRLYNAHLETCRVFFGHTQPINDISFSHDQRYILSVSKDNTLAVWDVISQKIVNQVIFKKPITSIDTSRDGELVATVSHNSRQVDLWHNVLYMTPTTQVLMPLAFKTLVTYEMQQDARIYHYLYRNRKVMLQNQMEMQQHIDNDKLKEYINVDIKDKRDSDVNLVQMTSQAISRWMPLIDLDEIKMRNKIEIKETSEAKIPFFLDFENKNAIKQQFEQEKKDDVQIKSQILEKQKQTNMEEGEGNDLQRLIEQELKEGQGQQVLEYLQTLQPSQVDYQFRQQVFHHIENILGLVNQWFDNTDDFDLKSTYFNALLNIGYDSILINQNARNILKQIHIKEKKIRDLIQHSMLKSICLLEKFTHIKS